ncbi:MAG TPA: nodulation protein NodH, partial [Paracoccaceae bacterium]|nr:nodulation protein NodH [Paracoccaceae bacterium]
QIPGAREDLVANPGDVTAALAGIDRSNLSRTPNFEPRRSPAIPTFLAAGKAIYMPVQGGPVAPVSCWLRRRGPATGDFVQKSLRQWKRAHPGHRSFTVVRHPLARAHAAFCDRILTGALPEVRGAFARTMGLDLPPAARADDMTATDHRAAFLSFLRFAKMNLSGQTPVRVDAAIATQAAVIQGFAQIQGPDLILREDRLAEGLAFVSAETGQTCPDLPAAAEHRPVPLGSIVDAELQEAARDAYARDVVAFGF